MMEIRNHLQRPTKTKPGLESPVLEARKLPEMASFLQNEIQKGSAKEMASLKHKATEKPEAEPVEEDNHTTANIKDLDYGDLDSIGLEDCQETIEINSNTSEESS